MTLTNEQIVSAIRAGGRRGGQASGPRKARAVSSQSARDAASARWGLATPCAECGATGESCGMLRGGMRAIACSRCGRQSPLRRTLGAAWRAWMEANDTAHRQDRSASGGHVR